MAWLKRDLAATVRLHAGERISEKFVTDYGRMVAYRWQAMASVGLRDGFSGAVYRIDSLLVKVTSRGF